MRKVVSQPEHVVANILRFAGELAASPRLRDTLGHVHAWYAYRNADGSWAFGPSKFVGYPDNTAAKYLSTYRNESDGRKTEHALSRWFQPVDPTSRLGRNLAEALTSFLEQWGRSPRSGARISVVMDEPESFRVEGPNQGDALLSRISSDPAICGGRPCIKGTRMRVSDVLDMMASGATIDEILADYPYLSAEDIRAALAYAARGTNHRVIQAA